MRWEKLGWLFAPSGEHWWARSHASTPCGLWRPDGLLRVYFTSRDDDNRSHIGWVDLDPDRNFSVVEVSPTPVLAPGERGLFDDSGVAAGCVVESDGVEYLFYVGWNLKVTVPWMNAIGLAVRDGPEDAFVKQGRVPLLDRSEEDPFSLSYPWVIRDGQVWRMWYGSNSAWGAHERDMAHVVKYAESTDGFRWTRRIAPVIDLLPGEYAISRPQVRRVASGWEMFYCRRGTVAPTTYRLGYATSSNGMTWERLDDEVGLDVSDSGWDSEMVCYPFVFEHGDTTWTLYNGNDYGRTGFGLARRL